MCKLADLKGLTSEPRIDLSPESGFMYLGDAVNKSVRVTTAEHVVSGDERRLIWK